MVPWSSKLRKMPYVIHKAVRDAKDTLAQGRLRDPAVKNTVQFGLTQRWLSVSNLSQEH